MKNTTVFELRLTLSFAVLCSAPAWSQEYQPPDPRHADTASTHGAYGEQLGIVRFPVSCTEEARPLVERGVALLHHMTYLGANEEFAAATQADPNCAMGYWGQAMTYIHPLWTDPPTESDFEKGRALVRKAKTRGKKTARERAYVAAVNAYYEDGQSLNETKNLASFAESWQVAHRLFPNDTEATAFFALALLGTVDPDDKTYAVQKRAGALAEAVLRQEPNHPGGHHYAIHAYDYPPLAGKALQVARHYGEIAPAVPHALHMPAHIFTRLGLWDESIALNKRAVAAALKHPAAENISTHYLHPLDYLAYAYLQRGEDDEARAIHDKLSALDGPFQIGMALAYTLAAVPARVTLERQHWTAAAALEPRTPAGFKWEKFPAIEAITHFARALGAARSGNSDAALQSIGMLTALRDEAAKTSDYWAQQVEIQRLTAEAWLAFAEGRKDEALKTMRQASELEASTEKHPVTPGEVLPAQELFADMLFEEARYAEAQAQYLGVLERRPNRFNSLYGAGRSAEMLKDESQATFYYRKLVDVVATGAEQERVKQAKVFLAK